MGAVGLLGSILRFIFVYRLNYKKMHSAYIANKVLEKNRDITAGIIGFALILITMIISYELFISPK